MNGRNAIRIATTLLLAASLALSTACEAEGIGDETGAGDLVGKSAAMKLGDGRDLFAPPTQATKGEGSGPAVVKPAGPRPTPPAPGLDPGRLPPAPAEELFDDLALTAS